MISLSICMIVKNEEEVLERCLNCACDIADELIIVDTGSSDKTKDIAFKFTDKVYDYVWMDDFSAARNVSFEKATKDYIMWLDADDVILQMDREKIAALKSQLSPQTDIVEMKYNLTKPNSEEVVSSLYRERIVKREKNYKWKSPVHEYIDCKGSTVKADIAITHRKQHMPTKRNLEIFEKYIAAGNELDKRNWFYYARELFVWGQFDQAIVYYDKFLNTDDELESKYLDSCIELSECYKQKGEGEKVLTSLLRFFEKAGPRGEICCRLGYYFKDHQEYEKAIEWFKIAPNTQKNETMGKISLNYWGYVPYMELCSCSYKLGRIDDAIFYNEKAAEFAPTDDKILKNRCFLGNIKLKTYEESIRY